MFTPIQPRRREREQKKGKSKTEKAPKKRPPPKKEPPKKRGRAAAKKDVPKSDDEDDDDYAEGVPDTSGDAALAQSMAGKRVSTRNLDAKGNKFKRAAALAKIREVSMGLFSSLSEIDSPHLRLCSLAARIRIAQPKQRMNPTAIWIMEGTLMIRMMTTKKAPCSSHGNKKDTNKPSSDKTAPTKNPSTTENRRNQAPSNVWKIPTQTLKTLCSSPFPDGDSFDGATSRFSKRQ